MQAIKKTLIKGFKKGDKHKTNDSDTDIKFPFLQRFVSETKSFKSEVKQIIKWIEDINVEDNTIVDYIRFLISRNEEVRVFLQSYRDSDYMDNLSLLHFAAKFCRFLVCEYLVNEISINLDIQTKRKMNALHFLIKYNSFKKDLKLTDQISGSTDLEDEDPKQQSDVNEPLILDGSIDVKKSPITEKRDRLKIKFKKTLEFLIEQGCNVNEQDELGSTPLHYAALNDNYEAVLMLTVLAFQKIKLDIRDESQMTPLHIAFKNAHEDVACLLIDKTDMKILNNLNDQNLPLHLVCKAKKESIAIVKKLLDKIKQESLIDLHNMIDTIDSEKQTTLNILIDKNHLKLVDLLLKDYYTNMKDDFDKNGNLPIHLAARNGSVELFNILVKNDAISFKNNSNGDNPLHIAAENNKFNFIKEFLEYERVYVEKNELKGAHQLTALGLNRERYTPLFLAIIGGHTKTVEQFVTLDYIKLDAYDKYGNTIFHICAEYNNQESLRVILRRKDSRIIKGLYMKNKKNETVLHTASEYENLEIIKLVLNKVYDGFMPVDTFLKTRNKEGQTFFHIACIKGYFNIVEYFLKDLKMKYLLEMLDKDLNSPLHLASMNNHLSIVNLIIDAAVGLIDFGAKNKDGHTALELSCRKGFFEISKTLINRNPKKIEAEQNANDDPLHVACNEGSYEVVRLLLGKGAPIDVFNNENKNCLDIAIEKEHREVIKVLLEDPNWYRLFLSEVKVESDELQSTPCKKKSSTASNSSTSFNYVIKESPQFNAMYEKKMWDLIKIVLDNCHKGDDFEFKILDPPIKDLNYHPLTLLAKSGQETLLKHDTTLMLLNLKWRFIPRFFFYSNLLFYLFFLVLFSIYILEIHQSYVTHIQVETATDSSNSTLEADENISARLKRSINHLSHYRPDHFVAYLVKPGLQGVGTNEPDKAEKIIQTNFNTTYIDLDSETNSNVRIYLITILALISFKKFLQIILISRLSFFSSMPDWIEIITYGLTLATILIRDVETKFSCGSVAILLSFFVLLFLIQKLQVFGLFVLAFNKTLVKSATFLPVFLIIYAGFTISFRLRSQFGVSYFNTKSESLSIIRTFSMVTGDFSGSDMGLESWSFVNYLLYCLFISVMCIIILNMLVGIAVGEISTILNEADIQQISMRIIFVMKCQDVLKNASEKPFLKKCICLRFEKYTYDDEYSFIKVRDKIIDFFIQTFSSREPAIKLDDPQKRLEDNLTELARITNSDLKTIREVLTNQINDVAAKLNNAQQRLEDSLLESSRKNVNNLESTKEDSSSQMVVVEANLKASQDQILFNVKDVYRMADLRFYALKQSFLAKFKKLEDNIMPPQMNVERTLMDLIKKTNDIIKTSNREFLNLEGLNKNCINQMNEFLNINKSLVTQTSNIFTTTTSLVTQMNHFKEEIKKMNEDILNLAKQTSYTIQIQTNIMSEVNEVKTSNKKIEDEVKLLKDMIGKLDEEISKLPKRDVPKEEASSHPPPPPPPPPGSMTPPKRQVQTNYVRGNWRN